MHHIKGLNSQQRLEQGSHQHRISAHSPPVFCANTLVTPRQRNGVPRQGGSGAGFLHIVPQLDTLYSHTM